MCIIIGDVHQFIGNCLIPLDPCHQFLISKKNINSPKLCTPPMIQCTHTHTHIRKHTDNGSCLLFKLTDCCSTLVLISFLSLTNFLLYLISLPLLSLFLSDGFKSPFSVMPPGSNPLPEGVCVWGEGGWHTHSLLSCHMGIQHLHSADISYIGWLICKNMVILYHILQGYIVKIKLF